MITTRKAWAQAERRSRQKRGGLVTIESADHDLAVSTGPTPEFAAMVAEEFDRLLAALDDEDLRRVALWRMEGFTVDEIADRLGCARRTVARRLDLIRKTWLDDCA